MEGCYQSSLSLSPRDLTCGNVNKSKQYSLIRIVMSQLDEVSKSLDNEALMYMYIE